MELEGRNAGSGSLADTDSIKQTENFIDAMFIENAMFIEGTVKKCFEELSSNFLDKMKGYVDEAVRIKKLSFDDDLLFGDSDTRLISKLNSEISFLRDEIKNKNFTLRQKLHTLLSQTKLIKTNSKIDKNLRKLF